MFFGRVITQSDPFIYSEQTVDETVGDVISISNVALAPNSKEDATLIMKRDGDEFVIATLTRKNPQIAVNLYVSISQQAELRVRGNGIIHVIGFFEPQPHVEHLDEIQLHHRQLEEQKIQEQSAKLNKEEKKQKQLPKQKAVNQSREKTAPAKEQKKKQEIKQVEPKIRQQQVKQKPHEIQVKDRIHQTDLNQEREQEDQSQDDGDIENEEIQQQSQGSSLVGLENIDDDIGTQNPTHKINSEKKHPSNIRKVNGAEFNNKNKAESKPDQANNMSNPKKSNQKPQQKLKPAINSSKHSMIKQGNQNTEQNQTKSKQNLISSKSNNTNAFNQAGQGLSKKEKKKLKKEKKRRQQNQHNQNNAHFNSKN